MIRRTKRLNNEINISSVIGINREVDFRRHVVVYYTIEDIPWAEDESAAFDGDVQALTEAVELGLSRRGEHIKKIHFHNEKWKIDETTFNFTGFPAALETKARKFVLHEIIDRNWKSFETISNHLGKIRRFFIMFESTRPGFILGYLHSYDVRRFFEESNMTSSTKANILSSLLLFFKFISDNYKNEHFSIDLKDLADLKDEATATAKMFSVKREYPTVPDKIFYQMHFKCMDLIRNAKTPFDDKVVACMIILFMWTGLRPKEIRILRRHCLVERMRENVLLQFYEYRSPKNKGKVSPCLLFPAAKEAMHVLEGLQIRHEAVNKTDYLISFWDNVENKPETSGSIENAYNHFCFKYLDEICSKPIGRMACKKRKDKIIYRPSFYSFRVHLCTYLIDHGYDERWVEGHLGHISPMMLGKYYRMRESTRDGMRTELKVRLPVMTNTLREIAVQLDNANKAENIENKNFNPMENIINLLKNE